MTNVVLKDWLGAEHARNKAHAELYVRMIKMAIGRMTKGARVEVLIGHHLTFELGEGESALDLNTENEIPSADCLMFDHDIMKAIFGAHAVGLMMNLAAVPCEEREQILELAMSGVEA